MHKLSRKLADVYDYIRIKDLNTKAMSKALNFRKSVCANGWKMFTIFLKYNLEETGKRLTKVDSFFVSSQTCSECGYKNEEVKDLAVRSWICLNFDKCHDMDTNATINIRYENNKHPNLRTAWVEELARTILAH